MWVIQRISASSLFFTSAEAPPPIFSPNTILIEGLLTKGAISGWGVNGTLLLRWVGGGGVLDWGSTGVVLLYWFGFEFFNTRRGRCQMVSRAVVLPNLQDLGLEWLHSCQFSRVLFSDRTWLYFLLLAFVFGKLVIKIEFWEWFRLPINQCSCWRSVSTLLGFAFNIFYSGRFACFLPKEEMELSNWKTMDRVMSSYTIPSSVASFLHSCKKVD